MKITFALVLIIFGFVLFGISLPEDFQKAIGDIITIPLYKEKSRVLFSYIVGILVGAGIMLISRRD